MLLARFARSVQLRVNGNHCKSIHYFPDRSQKNFAPDGRGLFQHDSSPIYRVQGLNDRVKEAENDEEHTLCPSQSPDNCNRENYVRQHSILTSLEHKLRELSF